jgi:hypothetical protein
LVLELNLLPRKSTLAFIFDTGGGELIFFLLTLDLKLVVSNLDLILLLIVLLLELFNEVHLLLHLVVEVLHLVFVSGDLTVFASHFLTEFITLLSDVTSLS